MLNRKIDSKIASHFVDSSKALFLTGARQVGKTYAVRKYAGQHGLGLVELNFLLQPEVKSIFEGARDVSDLLLRMSAYTKVPMAPGKTVIFFDEVQEYADVVTWVKALVDEGSYQYVLSGSLLGVEMKDIRSVPVEVKSGKSYERHNALCNVIKTPDYGISKAYVLCNDNVQQKDSILYLPVYMVMFIRKPAVCGDLIYKVDLGGL